ncbi:hypothetical protein [Parvularcula mediterranea]|nr:hypothetical protein [Parvularcula mediterranea]
MLGRLVFLMLAAPLAACGTTPATVSLEGQFTPAAPPPAEVRVMLDPHYGHTNCEIEDKLTLEGTDRADPYVSLAPDESGSFRLRPIAVAYKRKGMKGGAPLPTFFLGFFNEQDTIYAVGHQHSAFHYRTFDAATKEPVPRADACWRVVQGDYDQPEKRSQRLVLFLAPNFDSPKTCLPEGVFTPGGVVHRPHFEE